MLELSDGRTHCGLVDSPAPARVADERRGGERAFADGVRDDVQALDAFEVLRDALVRAGSDLEPEDGKGEEEQEGRRPCGHRGGVAHHSAGEPPPEVVLGVAPVENCSGNDPYAIEPVDQEVHEHREKRQRAGDRDERDDEAADPEPAHERERHEEHEREADSDR